MSAISKTGINTSRNAPEQFGDHMEAKVGGLLRRIEASEAYASIFDPAADPRYLAVVIKHVLLEIFSYGPHVAEATFTAIGRMPKARPDLMRAMVSHNLDEVNHSEMALQDFVRLGGDETWARERRISPASFAMAATVRMLAETESPFAYLGYMYPFEALTPVLAERLQRQFSAKGFPSGARRFVDLHATEDIAHAKSLRALIETTVREHPGAASAIEYGFDCFAVVYPLPIWGSAVANAHDDLSTRGGK